MNFQRKGRDPLPVAAAGSFTKTLYKVLLACGAVLLVLVVASRVSPDLVLLLVVIAGGAWYLRLRSRRFGPPAGGRSSALPPSAGRRGQAPDDRGAR